MRLSFGILIMASLVNAAVGQSSPVEAAHLVHISKLVIESDGLSATDRQRIVRLFQDTTYPEGEIADQVRDAARSMGYFMAIVDEPKFSFAIEGGDVATVVVRANAGARYRLGEIDFQANTVFPPAQLRSLFLQRSGDLFNTTTFSSGLEHLRNLYATRGYVNMVAVPRVKIHESRRILYMTVEVDEGQAYDFGRLNLVGVESHLGLGEALLNSWKLLEGKRFNPEELKHWLLANKFDSKVSNLTSDAIDLSTDSASRSVNVRVAQWPME